MNKIKYLIAGSLVPFLTLGSALAQSDDNTVVVSTGGTIGGLFGGLIGLVIAVLMVVSMWKVFVKAGQPGWACLIPIYNLYILIKVAGRPGWWILLFLIPFVNFVIGIIISLDIAKNFGKSALFGIGLIFLGFIFYPILAFSDDTYKGSAA